MKELCSKQHVGKLGKYFLHDAMSLANLAIAGFKETEDDTEKVKKLNDVMKLVNTAADVLRNEELRATYDKSHVFHDRGVEVLENWFCDRCNPLLSNPDRYRLLEIRRNVRILRFVVHRVKQKYLMASRQQMNI